MIIEGSRVIKNPFIPLIQGQDGDVIVWGGLQQVGGESQNAGGTKFPIIRSNIMTLAGEVISRRIEIGNKKTTWEAEINYDESSLTSLTITNGFEYGGISSLTNIKLTKRIINNGVINYEMNISTFIRFRDIYIPHFMTFRYAPERNVFLKSEEILDGKRIYRWKESFDFYDEKDNILYPKDRFIDFPVYNLLLTEDSIILVPKGDLVENKYGIFYNYSPFELMKQMIDFYTGFQTTNEETLAASEMFFGESDFMILMKGKFLPMGITI